MARLIGTVRAVVGDVFAVASNGTKRLVIEGDKVYAGELLETGATGAVAVHLAKGGELTLGRDSSMPLTQEILANHATHVDTPDATAPSPSQLADVQQLQQLIAAGADPSQVTDAPAAGTANPGGSPSALGGGHTFVLLTETAGVVNPVVGFPTAGITTTFLVPEGEVGRFGDGSPGDNLPPIVTPPDEPPVVTLPPDQPPPDQPPPDQPPPDQPPPDQPPPDQPPSDEPPPPPVNYGVALGASEVTLNEANLADGSAPNSGALTQNGVIKVSAPDGLLTLTIGGVDVVVNGVPMSSPQTITLPSGNTLTILGYNPSTGEASYTYTLTGPETHNQGAGTVNDEQIPVHAVDSNGDAANGSINVHVLDDVPQANPDIGYVKEGGETSGNILGNDVAGADGPGSGGLIVGVRAGDNTSAPVFGGVGTVIQGLYGTLTVDASGQASYVANPNSGGHDDVKDIFTYTIRDADGDTSTTTVTVNVYHNDGVIIGGSDCTLNEANLPDGTDPNAAALTQTGTVKITAPDGLQTLTVGGINVVENGNPLTSPQSVTLPSGSTFTVLHYDPATGEVTYSYTLNGAETHNQGDGTVNNEQIAVHAVDNDGDTADGNINVHVTDDVPQATADIGYVKEGGETSGNILANDHAGADGPGAGGLIVGVRAGDDTSTPVTGGVGTVIQGLYGTLTVDASGQASYMANPNSGGHGDMKDIFTYSIRDADGDTSTTTITVNVYHNDGPMIGGGDCTVDEANLPGGSHPDHDALTQTGTIKVTAPDGVQNLIIGGIVVVDHGVPLSSPQSTTLPSGNSLTVLHYDPTTGDVTYTYTLNEAENHNQGDGTSLSDPIPVHAVDTNGDVRDGTLVVKILDDTPQAHSDIGNVVAGGETSGNLLLNDTAGADGAGPNGLIVGVRAGGDTTTPVIGGLNTVITGAYGTLIVDNQGNATYHSDPSHVGPQGEQDVFTYTIRDADGDTSTTTVTVNINVAAPCPPVACNDNDVTVQESALDTYKDGQDLAPGIVTGSNPGSTAETGSGSVANSVQGGTGALTFTAEGAQNGTVQGQYGVLHLNTDGSYTYTLTSPPSTTPAANDGANVTHEAFNYTVTDSLGQSSTAQIVVNIVDDQPQAANLEKTVTTDPVNSNLMLIVDNSASMNEASGVNGLTRLGLEKQAIVALLDKYEALGDVRVQLVTFNSQANIASDQWVDVATAKNMVNAITAGNGTNYDAALASAQTAFVQKGALAGAQNLAYFFSDGNPTVSPEHSDPDRVPNPARGDGISPSEEAVWTHFLDSHGINAFAIGVGTDISSQYLNPVAYNGATGSNTSAVIVTDLGQLNAVLSGTVQGGVQGSLLEGGTFGADQGFVKSISVDGTTYTFNPQAFSHQGGVTVSGGPNHGSFEGMSNTLTVTGEHGTLVVNMNTGDYSYTPAAGLTQSAMDNIHYVLSDYDGDLAGANLVVHVEASGAVTPTPVYDAPVAVADNVITNLSGSSIVIPGAALAANDQPGTGGALTVSPGSFATGWTSRGADFKAGSLKTINFSGTSDSDINQLKNLSRSDFFSNTATTALLVISGYLGAVNASPSNAQDLYSVQLKAGETVTVDHNLTNDVLGMAWKFEDGAAHSLSDGGSFTATEDGTYRLIVVNQADPDLQGNYELHLSIDTAAVNTTPDVHSTYTLTDAHGGSSTAPIDISHQDGHTVLGTTGDDVLIGAANSELHGGDGNDVLVAGPGNNELFGDNGNDMLFSGPGNDLLDGGAGNNTANYSLATAGVTVSTAETGPQHTGGAGTDTLVNIQNLIGSNYNDHLTGDSGNNVLNGGLGNDVLNGGAGDDTLIGGPGNNTLTGGPGHDTFLYQAGNTGHDTITDFNFGIDKLDLSQLLQGEHGDANSLENFLHFSVSGNGSSLVSTIDVSSIAGGAATQTIDLAGVNLAQHYGVTPGAGGAVAGGADTASIINGMLGDHSLKVDTV
ncbi:retention module-containing protein [Pseudomonas sp. SLFW]|uniref:retention module-containing protein n=1 Tax=Pseudomonas sp. SLFW TaxID=2683259 RepID=UPI0014121D1E|nr:retention module-containing protein [Pseudomonas sp. SLFW]NBB08125.1 retention module-containing protein [Pseudomonas sp. SLFW]